MTSRGFDGTVQELAIVGAGPRATAPQWLAALTPAVAAVLVSGSAGAPMNAPAIRVENLSYHYPDGRVALDGVDLNIAPGERVAILGPNGAGKTTLMLHLNGVLSASSGTVEIGGMALNRKNLREIRRRVGVVFRIPTTSCSCRPSRRTSRSARRTSGSLVTRWPSGFRPRWKSSR